MRKLKELLDKLLDIAPGNVYGLMSMFIGAGAIIISLSLHPSYNMTIDHVSWLGVGPGLVGPLFNIGLISAGLIAIPFFISLGKILKQQDNGNENIKARAVQISIIACISLTLVGCFPAINIVMLVIHGVFAAMFFFAGLFLCILFSYLMLKDTRFSNIQAILGFIIAGFFLLYIFTFQPLFEWIVFFAIVFWIVETAIYILHKKL